MNRNETKNLKNEIPEAETQEDKNGVKTQETKPEELKLQLLKKGDYLVHVLIEEVRNLFQKDPNTQVFPIVKISCFNKTQRTPKLKSGATNYIYSEHFYFEKQNLSVEELDSEKIVVEVYDSSFTDKKDYLGIYEMDFAYIYNHINFSINNRWIALANPEADDITKVRGYLKLSICVLHEKDPRVELKYKSTDNVDSICIIPPHVKIEFMQLYIYLFKAEKLPDMDYMVNANKIKRKCNGFVTLKYMGIEISTDVKDMESEIIIWNQVICLPVSLPVVSNRLVFTVWDKDVMSNDIVGTFEISLLDIFSGHHKNFKYKQIYGAPVGKTGVMSNKMNANPEIGSLWKGRILLKIDYEKTEKPTSKCINIQKDKEFLLKEAGKLARPNQWIFNINLFEAFFLPKEEGLYSIKIAIQDQEKTFSEPIKANKRMIKFNIKSTMQLQTLSDNLKDIGDVFIYLVENGVNVCFLRLSAETFFNNDDLLVLKFLPDPSIGKIKETVYSGLVKLKIQIVNKAINVPISMANAVPIGEPKDKRISTFATNIKPNEPEEEDLFAEQKRKRDTINKKQVIPDKSYLIVANIYMTRHLVAGHSNGTSNLYTVLKLNEKEVQTTVKYDSLNCIWNESRVFENVQMDLDNKSTWPIIFLKVMDKEKFNYSDNLIAYNYIWLSDSNYHINSLDKIQPKWHQLCLPFSNSPQGQILLSFLIIDMKLNQLTPIAANTKIRPDTILYTAEINVLGLRGLKPLAFLPIKKAFITFDLNSCNVTGKDDGSMSSIRTLPKKPGPNPTINTILKFDIRLPKEHIFMPELQCTVHDYILAGMVNQMLGLFFLPLKEIIKENSRDIEKDMKITERKIGLFLLGDKPKINCQTNSVVSEGDDLSRADNFGGISKNYSSGHTLLLNDKPNVDNIVDPNVDIKLNFDTNKENLNPLNPIKAVKDQNYMNDPKNFVIFPVYKKYYVPGTEKMKNSKQYEKEDESEIPDLNFYEAVGYNKDPTDGKKHYRRIFHNPLEKITEFDFKSPFYSFPLKRGKYVDRCEETGMFDALKFQENMILKRFKTNLGDETITDNSKNLEDTDLIHNSHLEDKEFGEFKGLIRIVEKSKLNAYEKMIDNIKSKGDSNFVKEFRYLTRFEEISKKILVEKKVYVRLYIIKLGDLAKKDILSESDPYLKITLGNQIIDESKNYKEDSKNADWCSLGAVLPGDPILKIEVWDYDPIFSDELIGFTKIDIEDRFYNDRWMETKDKPIEKRILKHHDFEDGQGWITLWLEIFENRIDAGKKWDVSPPPKIDLELRMIVWETENIPLGDVEGVSDQYVLCYVDHNDKQSTDLHYRCQGKGSYNWRIVMPLSAPRENTIMNVMVMDKDFFSADDYLAGNSLQLSHLIKDVYELDIPIKFNQNFWNALPASLRGTNEIQFKDNDKFWLKLYKQGPNGVENGGRILLSLEMLPKSKALICKVGKGRESPNVNPHLPEPLGRFEWSINPFKMINQCVGPEYRAKIYCLCCCSLIILFLLAVIPYIILHLSAEAINPYNYKIN